MLGSPSNPEAGKRLRAERMRVRLSTREVERLSRQIAEEKSNQDYYISHAWLINIEHGEFTPSIYKLYSLSLIYKQSYEILLGFFGIEFRNIGREQMRVPLPRTHLISESWPKSASSTMESVRSEVQYEKTNLVSQMFQQWGSVLAALPNPVQSRQMLYGYIGTEDFTLDPLIRPGSFVEIDTQQRKVIAGSWSNVFDRPIYFVELREGYACSWCEVKERQLLLVPFPQSSSRIRQIRFPHDGEILGRVTAVSMRLPGSS